MRIMRIHWTEREVELLKEAWNTTAYSREDLERIFKRNWRSLETKASRVGLPPRYQIEQQAKIDAIERVLKEDHII